MGIALFLRNKLPTKMNKNIGNWKTYSFNERCSHLSGRKKKRYFLPSRVSTKRKVCVIPKTDASLTEREWVSTIFRRFTLATKRIKNDAAGELFEAVLSRG